MKFTDELHKYLAGELFDSALKVKMADGRSILTDSISFLKEYARGRRIIHVGAADHRDSIDRKIANGNWLHAHLLETAQHCIGVDISRESIDWLKQHHGIGDIYCADIVSDDLSFLDGIQWDYVFLPDMLEHVPDASLFLQKLHARLTSKCSTLVITVPNAFCLRNVNNVLFKGIERINSDHRYWFSPYTLAKLLTGCGFGSIRISYVMRNKIRHRYRPHNLLKAAILKKKNYMMDTIVAECTF